MDFRELGMLKGLAATNSLAIAREDRGDIRRGQTVEVMMGDGGWVTGNGQWLMVYAAGMAISSDLPIPIPDQFPQPVPYHLLRELTLDYSSASVMVVVPAA